MRYFSILGLQHVTLFVFPTLVFMVLLAIGLGFYHIQRQDAADRQARIIERYPEGIEGRNAPFPLIAYLILSGTVVWVVLYIVLIGVLEVAI